MPVGQSGYDVLSEVEIQSKQWVQQAQYGIDQLQADADADDEKQQQRDQAEDQADKLIISKCWRQPDVLSDQCVDIQRSDIPGHIASDRSYLTFPPAPWRSRSRRDTSRAPAA